MTSTKKYIYMTLGTIFLVIGMIGIVLPLIPTTPLLLLTAFFYARSSEKLYQWLLNHRIFGKYIKQFKSGQGIPLRAKITILTLIWVTGILSIVFIIPITFVKVLLVIIFLAVSYYILSLKTLRS